MINWFKTLFRLVREAQEDRPIKLLVRYVNGRIGDLGITLHAPRSLQLPKLMAREIKENEAPEMPIMAVFDLIYCQDYFALYEERP